MINICVCDDNQNDIRYIKNLLHEFSQDPAFQPCDVSMFSNPFEMLDDVEKSGGFDVYLLDIIMPGLDGMTLAKEIRKRKESAEILFLTTSEEYGVAAFDVKATGYLLKPIEREKFAEILHEILDRLTQKRYQPIFIKTAEGIKKIETGEIVMIESFNYYREITLASGSLEKTSSTLSELGKLIENYSQFCLPHRSYIVNMDYITGFSGSELTAKDKRVPIARGSLKSFKDAYMQYVFGDKKFR